MLDLDFSADVRLFRNIRRDSSDLSNEEVVLQNGNDPLKRFPYFPYSRDYLFVDGAGFWNLGIISPPLRLKDTLGLPAALKTLDNPLKHHTQKPQGFKWDGREDFKSYGSLLTNLEGIAHGTSFPGNLNKVVQREKGVTHLVYKGHLRSSALIPAFTTDDDLVTINGFDHRLYIPRPGYGYLGGSFVELNDDPGRDGDFNFTISGGTDTYHGSTVQFDGFEFAINIANSINTTHGGTYETPFEGGFKRTYSDVIDNCIVNKDGSYSFDLSYTYKLLTQYGFGAVWRVSIKYLVKFRASSPDGVFVNGAQRDFHSDTFELIDSSSVTPMYGIKPDEWDSPPIPSVLPNTYGVELVFQPTAFAYSSNSSSTGRFTFETFKRTLYDDLRHTRIPMNREAYLRSRFEADLVNLRPSSFLAASDALDGLVTVLDSNWLQNAQHLKDIVGILPDVTGLARILARFNDGDLFAIKDLADYLAQAILKWNFQEKPLIRDGSQIFQKDLLEAVNVLSQGSEHTIYGSYTYKFHADECYIHGTRQTLETRAKIKVKIDLGTLMTSIIAANSLGFWPNLSRLWSLVPFSFVVDWFTNMTARLHQVDNQILWLGFNTEYCVYSYKVRSYPSIGDLADVELIDASSDNMNSDTLYTREASDFYNQFNLSVYRRETSFIMPRLWDSHYDFLERTSRPNTWTVGSLLWQLI